MVKDHPEVRAVERRRRVQSIAVLVGAAVLGLALAVPALTVVSWLYEAVWSVLLP